MSMGSQLPSKRNLRTLFVDAAHVFGAYPEKEFALCV